MSVPRSVAEVLADRVTLEVESIDRMYLNVYVPGLQREQGVVNRQGAGENAGVPYRTSPQ